MKKIRDYLVALFEDHVQGVIGDPEGSEGPPSSSSPPLECCKVCISTCLGKHMYGGGLSCMSCDCDVKMCLRCIRHSARVSEMCRHCGYCFLSENPFISI